MAIINSKSTSMFREAEKQPSSSWGIRIIGILAVAGVLLSAAALLRAEKLSSGSELPADLNNDRIKAIFLDNGQVYFGKLKAANNQFALLEEPYYLERRTVLQEPVEEGEEAETEERISLTALGGEGLQIHSPEQAMYIPWDTILYIENLQDDSEVVKLMSESDEEAESEEEGEGEEE